MQLHEIFEIPKKDLKKKQFEVTIAIWTVEGINHIPLVS